MIFCEPVDTLTAIFHFATVSLHLFYDFGMILLSFWRFVSAASMFAFVLVFVLVFIFFLSDML